MAVHDQRLQRNFHIILALSAAAVMATINTVSAAAPQCKTDAAKVGSAIGLASNVTCLSTQLHQQPMNTNENPSTLVQMRFACKIGKSAQAMAVSSMRSAKQKQNAIAGCTRLLLVTLLCGVNSSKLTPSPNTRQSVRCCPRLHSAQSRTISCGCLSRTLLL